MLSTVSSALRPVARAVRQRHVSAIGCVRSCASESKGNESDKVAVNQENLIKPFHEHARLGGVGTIR